MSAELTPEALEILLGRHVAVLSTLVRGGPAMACVWYGIDGNDLIVSTPTGRRKDRNVRDDPRVALLVDVRDLDHEPGGLGYRGVEVRGHATVEPDPDGTLRRAIVARYLDPIPPEREERLRLEDRSIIRIRPHRVRTWDYRRGR
jgi:PPOX class probable F420-dependent enzyme